jgi:ribosome-associated protein
MEIKPDLNIPDSELNFSFVRSAGPGGQNVNKVATAAQLHFDVRNSPTLTAEVKERLAKLAGSRMTLDGMLVIEAKRYRTQEQNRADAILRLTELIRKATIRPKSRRATRPTLASRERRVVAKKKRGAIKITRKVKNFPED